MIQSFKTMDSVPMLDSGPFIKRELSHMLNGYVAISSNSGPFSKNLEKGFVKDGNCYFDA